MWHRARVGAGGDVAQVEEDLAQFELVGAPETHELGGVLDPDVLGSDRFVTLQQSGIDRFDRLVDLGAHRVDRDLDGPEIFDQ